jgi:hypothetical protein
MAYDTPSTSGPTVEAVVPNPDSVPIALGRSSVGAQTPGIDIDSPAVVCAGVVCTDVVADMYALDRTRPTAVVDPVDVALREADSRAVPIVVIVGAGETIMSVVSTVAIARSAPDPSSVVATIGADSVSVRASAVVGVVSTVTALDNDASRSMIASSMTNTRGDTTGVRRSTVVRVLPDTAMVAVDCAPSGGAPDPDPGSSAVP